MIVVDASVAVLALCNDGTSRRTLATERLAAPHLVDVEVAHAMRSRVRRDEVAPDHAHELLRTWARLGIERYAATGLLDRAWELRQNLSAYDATYVALAEALDVTLVTADRRLAGASGPRCPITTLSG